MGRALLQEIVTESAKRGGFTYLGFSLYQNVAQDHSFLERLADDTNIGIGIATAVLTYMWKAGKEVYRIK